MNNNLVETKAINDGVQLLYRFDNGYGASVVRHSFSYGREEGLWELVVIKWLPSGEFSLCYDTPITGGDIGYLTDDRVDELLKEIDKLPINEGESEENYK